MPNKKNVHEQLMNMATGLKDIYNETSELQLTDEKAIQVQTDLKALAELIYDVADKNGSPEPDIYDNICNKLNKFKESTVTFTDGSDRNSLPQGEFALFQKVNSVSRYLRENKDSLDIMLKATRQMCQFKRNYLTNGEEATILTTGKRLGIEGHRPTISECCTLSVEEDSMNKVYDRLIWLQKQHHEANLVDPTINEKTPSFYRQTAVRLQDELQKASPEKQVQFAEIFLRHDAALKERVYQKYTYYCQQVPDNAGQEDREFLALGMLYQDPDYIASASLTELKKELSVGAMGKLIDNMSSMGSEGMLMDNRPGYSKVSELTAGGIEAQFQNRSILDQMEKSLARKLNPQVVRSGIKGDSPLSKISKLYTRLAADQAQASGSFQEMKSTMGRIADMNDDEMRNPGIYIDALQRAKDAAEHYLETHKGHRFTKRGRERVEIASELFRGLSEELSLIKSPLTVTRSAPEPQKTQKPAKPAKLSI